ncbi:hypothetical protein A0H76_2777 [Hepatospora eriocheir]|uniref:Uncharacterized protein n=1 Tax=Hepatospora eriocheir TaxID=1081669 RepID=A0A1X0QJE8_9MICR|nr:hypothetical protein A0H76_2777 [Hepatospora eriocheir]
MNLINYLNNKFYYKKNIFCLNEMFVYYRLIIKSKVNLKNKLIIASLQLSTSHKPLVNSLRIILKPVSIIYI